MASVRVLFLTGEYPPMHGGIGDFTALLADRLADRGLEPAVLTAQRAGASAGGDGRVPVEPSLPHWGWSTWPTVLAAVDRWHPHVVHLQYQAAAFGMHPAIHLLPWWLRRRRPRLALAITFHDLRVPYLLPKAGLLRPLALRLLARTCDAVAATNEPDYQALLSWTSGIRRAPVLIPLAHEAPARPLPAEARRQLRQRLGIADQDLLICCFGLLNRSKGIEHLLQATAQMREEGLRPRLMFLGGTIGASDPTDVAYRQLVLAKVGHLSLDPLVVWTGYLPREDVGLHLEAADVAALPYTDGASIRRTSLIATLVHGLPLVTTVPREEGAAAPLRHEENCLLVASGDHVALAAALRRLALDPELRARLAAGARRASVAFDWSATLQASLALYASLVRQG
ncbi:MAG: glycosyltransferase family 4 protein [Chloroflexi bacterium]|nr:glycosyltransferase family 4 protein [Chloroflexota bacterium]